MKTFIDPGRAMDLGCLYAHFEPSVLSYCIKHRMRTETKIKFLSGLREIQQWFRQNAETLYILNWPRTTEEQDIIRAYLTFLEKLSAPRWADVGVDSKQWSWFTPRWCQEYTSFSLQIDEDKVLQAKELQKARVRENKECVERHIPLDITDPKELYSFLSQGIP
jgi:hypothetical protein